MCAMALDEFWTRNAHRPANAIAAAAAALQSPLAAGWQNISADAYLPGLLRSHVKQSGERPPTEKGLGVRSSSARKSIGNSTRCPWISDRSSALSAVGKQVKS